MKRSGIVKFFIALLILLPRVGRSDSSAWDYDRGIMGIDSNPYKKACINSSNNKYFSSNDDYENLKFCIRFSKVDDGGYAIYVITTGGGALECGRHCSVEIKFDSDHSVEIPGSPASHRDMLFIDDEYVPIDNKNAVEKVRNSSKMRIQVLTAGDGLAIFDFDIAGLYLTPLK